MRKALTYKANPNAVDMAGFTALQRGVQSGSREIVTLMLDQGADIHARSVNGMTALLVAAELGRDELMVLLMVLLMERGLTPR